jgi:hypothetical protein
MTRLGSIQAKWPAGFKPGPGVSNLITEGAFVIAMRPAASAQVFLNSNKDLSDPGERTKYDRHIISTMKNYLKDKGEEVIFCGEVLDAKLWEFKLNFLELKNNAHFVVVGQTRSGKTKSALSLIYTIAAAYPDAVWYFADAKNGGDFSNAASFLSEYPVAPGNEDKDGKLVEFANLIVEVDNEFRRRQSLFRKAPESCSSIYEYRALKKKYPEIETLPQIFFVADEFFKFTAEMDFDRQERHGNTLAGMLRTMIAQGGGYGIHFILISQKYQVQDIPAPVRSNLTVKLTHRVSPRDAQFNDLTMEENQRLEMGEFYLSAQGVFGMYSGVQQIRAKMHYIGNSDRASMESVKKPNLVKKTWNYDVEYLLYANQDELATPRDVEKVFMGLMRELGRDKLERIRDGIDKDTIQFVVTEDSKNIGITSLNKDLLTREHLQRVRAHADKHKCDAVIFYLLGVKPAELRTSKASALVQEEAHYSGVPIYLQTIYDLRNDRANVGYDDGSGIMDVFTRRLVNEKILVGQKVGSSSGGVLMTSFNISDLVRKYLDLLGLQERPVEFTAPQTKFSIEGRMLPFGSVGVFVLYPGKKDWDDFVGVIKSIAEQNQHLSSLAFYAIGDQAAAGRMIDDPKITWISKTAVEQVVQMLSSMVPDSDEMDKKRRDKVYGLMEMAGMRDPRAGVIPWKISNIGRIAVRGQISANPEQIIGLSLQCLATGESMSFADPFPLADFTIGKLKIHPKSSMVLVGSNICAPIGFTGDLDTSFEEPPKLLPKSKFEVLDWVLTYKSVKASDQKDLDLLASFSDLPDDE